MHYFSRVVIIFVLNFQLKQLTATKINTVTGTYFDVIIVFSYFFFLFLEDKADMLEWQNANKWRQTYTYLMRVSLRQLELQKPTRNNHDQNKIHHLK